MVLAAGYVGLPKYRQIALALRDEMQEGAYRAGELLPSEHELVERFRCSRATVSKAVMLLVDEGFVHRKQGLGTFVSKRPMVRPVQGPAGFSDHIRSLGREPGSTLLFSELIEESQDDYRGYFNVSSGDLVIKRLRTVDDKAVGTQLTWIPAWAVKKAGLTEDVVASPSFSLYSQLEFKGIELGHGAETLQAKMATPEETSIFSVEDDCAVLEVIRETNDANDQLLEKVVARYLGTEYLYSLKFRMGSQQF